MFDSSDSDSRSTRLSRRRASQRSPDYSESPSVRRSGRKVTPIKIPMFIYENHKKVKKYQDYHARYNKRTVETSGESESESDAGGNAEESMNESIVKSLEPNAAVLFEESRDVAGENMYTFRTPKKRNAMVLKAVNTPKTPKTPSTIFKSLSLDSPRTPKSHRAERLKAETTKTPHQTRAKIRKELKKRLAESEEEEESEATDDDDPSFHAESSEESESSADEGHEEDESSDSDQDREPSPAKKPKRNQMLKNVRVSKEPAKAPAEQRTRSQRRRNQLAEAEFLPESDNYFISVSNKKAKTSNHTLDRLKSSRLQHDDLFALLRSIEMSGEHLLNTTEMIGDYEERFGKWLLLLSKGFNIITYGIGSKQRVLQKFCETFPDYPYIIVNGFFPTITVKEILNTIRSDIVNIGSTARGEHEVIDALAEAFQKSPHTHLFLVVHNIDGPMLRKTKDQHILSRLSKIRNVHLIASIDHINAPLMWDQTCLSNYNFAWFDCTTMLPYTNETAFENSVFLQNSGELGLAAMCNVFQSLTANARGIYLLLVDSQMKNKKDCNYQGLSFNDLYHGCRERFLVSSDLALRTQLTEFVDHNMAKLKRSIDGTEHVLIPIETHVLEKFVEQQKE